MKRLAGIFLLSLYLFSFVEVHNLVKIPVLFEHFREHRQQQAGISFWSYISLHYLAPIVADDDYQRDQQLPFRNGDCCVMTAGVACECQNIVVDIAKPSRILIEFHLYDDVNKKQLISFDIFQPPRCA